MLNQFIPWEGSDVLGLWSICDGIVGNGFPADVDEMDIGIWVEEDLGAEVQDFGELGIAGTDEDDGWHCGCDNDDDDELVMVVVVSD